MNKTNKHKESFAFYRLWHIIGDDTCNPPIAPLIPVSRTTWLKGVKKGIYPAPIEIPNVSGKNRSKFWLKKDIHNFIEALIQQNNN